MAPERIAGLDRAWSERLRRRPSSIPRRLALLVSHSGDSLLWIAVAAWLWHARRAGEARAVALTVGVAALCVVAAKRVFRRGRPEAWDGAATPGFDRHSFPSGHAARAAGLAVALAPAPAAPLAWALAVGLARVAIGAHYLSDVIAGWGLGLLIGAVLRHVLP